MFFVAVLVDECTSSIVETHAREQIQQFIDFLYLQICSFVELRVFVKLMKCGYLGKVKVYGYVSNVLRRVFCQLIFKKEFALEGLRVYIPVEFNEAMSLV